MARLVSGNSAEVQGLKELQAKLRNLIPNDPKMAAQVNTAVADMAVVTRDLMRSSARNAGWPANTQRFIFATKEKDEISGQIFTALAGVSKGHKTKGHPMYREWGKRSGHIIGMGWSTMLEFGTTRMKARPAIRDAISQARKSVIDLATARYKQILGL